MYNIITQAHRRPSEALAAMSQNLQGSLITL